ncbi:coiled-coil domain-containing protein 17 [Brienomyrus brachyistius]|uniref:coiled-coil domain-containing protein 17 n=1 Tax=Brienomyrus brachyistius TaxID=42636 RepID=UPI0020B3C39B|nr:coiled-coil domain-containing protein 17 [Brienomyrus brachyistius]
MDLTRCVKCNMKFSSLPLLEKHIEKFCIGESTRKVDQTENSAGMVQRLRDYRRRHQERKEKLFDLGEPHVKAKATDLTDTMKPSSEPTDTGMLMDSRSKALQTQEREARARELAELHGKRAVDLENENRQLEARRRDIDLRMQELAAQTRSTSHVEKMLSKLQVQEQRNTILLEALMEQLQQVQMESVRVKPNSRQSESLLFSAKTKEKDSVRFHSYKVAQGDGTLSSEISALQLSYLQSGGSDHLILVQLQDLLKEALEVELHQEMQTHARPYYMERSKRARHTDKLQLNRDLIATELQNRRLEEEIMRSQRKRWRDSRLLSHPTEQKMKAMQTDMDLLKQEIEINHMRRRVRAYARPLHHSPLPPLDDVRSGSPALGRNFMDFSDGLESVPYDPIAGFVVFYDFLLGLCPSYRVCRLLVKLNDRDQEIGASSPLPVVYCEPASLSPHAPQHSRGSLATIAAKQAVPRVFPSMGVSLVLELQASEGCDPYGQQVTGLLSRGWVKVDVFDAQNHLISGKWKVPVRVLPVRPSVTTVDLNAVPQLDNTELYLRIVNSRDTEVQNSAPISHSNWRLYKYPLPVTGGTWRAARDSLRSSQFSCGQPRFPACTQTLNPFTPPGPTEELE